MATFEKERSRRVRNFNRQPIRTLTPAFYGREAVVVKDHLMIGLGFEIVNLDGDRRLGGLGPREHRDDPVPLPRPVSLERSPGFVRCRVLSQRMEIAVEIWTQGFEFRGGLARSFY